MGTKAKQYSRDFAARAVKLCDESGRPVSEVARDLGVEYATLYGWMKKAGKTKRKRSGIPVLIPGGPPETPEAMRAEIERLHRELDETKKQLEFAKKAVFFAQQNK